MYGDAFGDPPDSEGDLWSAGIGGFLHGYWWYLDVPHDIASVVDITKLEFAAILGNFDTFDVYLPCSSMTTMNDTKICIHADGYAAALGVNKQRVRNKEMSFVHDRLTDSDVFECRRDICTIAHEFGLGNVAADAASRNHSQRVYLLCASLGIRPIQLPPPESVRSLLSDLAQYVRHLSKEEQMQGRTRSNNEDGDQVAFDTARTPTKITTRLSSFRCPRNVYDSSTSVSSPS